MQTVVARQSSRVVARSTRSVSRVANVRVVCKASAADAVKKAAAAVLALPTLLAASPAFALVDERLNGDGTGLPLGISDGSIGWPMLAVFGLVWSIWYSSQKDLGDFEDKDSGLKID